MAENIISDGRERFLACLAKTQDFRGDEKAGRREKLADAVENEMTAFIRECGYSGFAPYSEDGDFGKSSFYDEISKGIFLDDAKKAANEQSGGAIFQALRLYGAFVQSRFFKGAQTTLAPGEKAAKKSKKSGVKHGTPAAPEPAAVPEPPADPLAGAEDAPATEGAVRQTSVTTHERNPKLRQRCLEIHGRRCAVCGFDFEEAYGEIGRGYVEVHHIHPIADTDGEHEVDPDTDLVPVCSNCHSMLHRGGSDSKHPLTPDELRQIYKRPK